MSSFAPLPPELLTPRLRMRPLRAGDLDALHAVWSHPRVTPWIGEHSLHDTREELQQHVRGPLGLYAVQDRETGRFLGAGGLQPFAMDATSDEVELGYDLHPDAWGRGYATELARAWTHHALHAMGLERVIAVVKPEHAASRRVLEKAGLRPAGERHAYEQDLLLYEALRKAPGAPDPVSAGPATAPEASSSATSDSP